jgi:hypothetical protein
VVAPCHDHGGHGENDHERNGAGGHRPSGSGAPPPRVVKQSSHEPQYSQS